MLIYFFSNQVDVCEKIAQQLETAGHLSVIVSKREVFYDYIHSNEKLPDLFVLDFSLFMHNLINIFVYLKQINRVTPIIFYNDPFPEDKSRKYYWEFLWHNHFPNMNLEYLENVIDIIANTINSPELKPYVSLIQKPIPIPQKSSATTSIDTEEKEHETDLEQQDLKVVNMNKKTVNIYEFRHKKNIPGLPFRILEYLYEHLETDVPMQDLVDIFDSKNKEKTSNITVYISRLRTYLKPEPGDEVRFDILTYKKTYRLIIL